MTERRLQGAAAGAELRAYVPPQGELALRVTAVTQEDRGWTVHWDGGSIRGGAVLLTAPVPQSLTIIDAGKVTLDPDVRAPLDAISYE